jgi:2-dehydropantoate 2-reductase
LADTVVADTLKTIDEKPAALKPSLLVDLEKGRRLEVDWIAGAVHRLGAKYGVETPVHSCVYAGLKPFSLGAL